MMDTNKHVFFKEISPHSPQTLSDELSMSLSGLSAHHRVLFNISNLKIHPGATLTKSNVKQNKKIMILC